jgi:hypothetical protein
VSNLEIKYQVGGGNVVVRFFSGVLLSHWIGQLSVPGVEKKRFDGKNNDAAPDELALSRAALSAGSELDWWVVVFAPTGPTVNYKVTVTVSQDGKELCDPIVRTGQLGSHQAKVESGELTFKGVA